MANLATKPTYELRFSNDETSAKLYIYDLIVTPPQLSESEVTSSSVVQALADAEDADTISVHINSAGGAVFEASAIYNALVAHPAEIKVHIDGLAASAASLIAMAGDSISMAENALLMIHEPSSMVWGNAEDMQKEIELLDRITETIVSTYAARTGGDPAEIRAMVEAETWFTAQEAKDAGFVDRITTAKRVAASFDFSRFTNTPKFLPSVSAERANSTESEAAMAKNDEITEPIENTEETPAEQVERPEESEAVESVEQPAAVATFADIENACPDCGAGFIVEQLKANATIDQARDAYATRQAEARKAQDEQIETLKAEVKTLTDKLASFKFGVGDDEAPDATNREAATKLRFTDLINFN